MSSPRLAVLISTHLYAQALLPDLQRSHFAIEHHCLAAPNSVRSLSDSARLVAAKALATILVQHD